MATVWVYGFSGKFTGSPEYEYSHPGLYETHKCMLFLAQDSSESQWAQAGAECVKYGFGEYSFERSGKLDLDALNTDAYRGFSGFYEEALEYGSALVYYPRSS
jgi:hypothetical protein